MYVDIILIPFPVLKTCQLEKPTPEALYNALKILQVKKPKGRKSELVFLPSEEASQRALDRGVLGRVLQGLRAFPILDYEETKVNAAFKVRVTYSYTQSYLDFVLGVLFDGSPAANYR